MAFIDFRFREQIVGMVGGDGLSYCFQCGACVGDCPAARYSERFNPRRIMMRALLGLEEELLGEGSSIWDCTSCCTCYDRCPQEVKPVDVIVALKNLATDRGTQPAALDQLGSAVLESGRNVVVSDVTRRRREELDLPALGDAPVEELRTLLQDAETGAAGNGAGGSRGDVARDGGSHADAEQNEGQTEQDDPNGSGDDDD